MDFSKIEKLEINGKQVENIKDESGIIIWEKKKPTVLISNGSQVVDTGIYCTKNMRCEIKIAWLEKPANATYIGAIQLANGTYLRCHFQCAQLNSDWLIGFWQDSPTLGNAISIPWDSKPHILTYSAINSTVGIDGNIVTHGNTPPTGSTFYLFDRNVVGFTANSEPGKCEVYYAKYWYGNKLVGDFVPNFDENGIYALYNKIDGTFHYDLNGNGFEYRYE